MFGTAAYNALTTLLAPAGALYLCARPRYWPLLGRFAPRVPADIQAPLWVHACSVGEVNTARLLVPALRRAWPGVPVLLSASTLTGRAMARALEPSAQFAWFPFDHALAVRRFVTRLRPRGLVLLETELWPNVLRHCAHAAVPVVVANARLSDKHFTRYRRLQGFLGPMGASLAAVGAQTGDYAARWEALGVPHKRIHVTGNIKFDVNVQDAEASECAALRHAHGIPPDAPVLVFGSTRPGDEALAAATFAHLRGAHPSLRLIVAPRHLDRLAEVVRALPEPVLLRSAVRAGQAPDGQPILVLDTLGELAAFYALATVAVIGGSFYPGVEGHNPVEPAALGVPTVFGPHMRNFPDLAERLRDAGAAIQVEGPDGLAAALAALLGDPASRARMGQAARETVSQGRGAIGRTVHVIGEALGARLDTSV